MPGEQGLPPEAASRAIDEYLGVLTRRLKNVACEMSFQVLAYNLKRAIAVLGVRPLIAAIQA